MTSPSFGPSRAVQDFINAAPFSKLQKVVFFLCFLTLVLDGFDTAAIGYIAPALMGEWGIAKSALAPVLSAAIFGLAAGAIVNGPVADRIGRKKCSYFQWPYLRSAVSCVQMLWTFLA